MAQPEPSQIVIGDTLSWLRSYTDVTYVDHDGNTQECKASDGWTLKYYYSIPGSTTSFTITASTHDTNDYLVSVTAVITATYIASKNYIWKAIIEKGSGASAEKYRIAYGTCEIVSAFVGEEDLEHIMAVIAACEAVFAGRASSGVAQYSIAGRSIANMPIQDVFSLYSKYKASYENFLAAQKIASGLATGRKILVRFPEY